MVGTSLFWPSTMPLSSQPVTTSVTFSACLASGSDPQEIGAGEAGQEHEEQPRAAHT